MRQRLHRKALGKEALDAWYGEAEGRSLRHTYADSG